MITVATTLLCVHAPAGSHEAQPQFGITTVDPAHEEVRSKSARLVRIACAILPLQLFGSRKFVEMNHRYERCN